MKKNLRLHHIVGAAAAFAVAGCVTAPPVPVEETLDARTGVTLTRLGEPVQLIAAAPRARESDPFAFLAPFDVNRMGEHRLYLWISVPAKTATPRVECAGTVVDLRPTDPDTLSISSAPYAHSAPWASYGIYELDAVLLACLGRDPKPAVLIGSEAADRFESAQDRTTALRLFGERVTR